MNPRCMSSPIRRPSSWYAHSRPNSWERSQKLLFAFGGLYLCGIHAPRHLVPFPEKAPPSSIGFLSTWDLSSPSPIALPFRCSTISVTHPSIRVQCGLRISTKGNLRQRCQSATLLSTSTLLRAASRLASGKVTKHSRGRHIALTRAVRRFNSLGYYPSGRPLEILMHTFDQPSAT